MHKEKLIVVGRRRVSHASDNLNDMSVETYGSCVSNAGFDIAGLAVCFSKDAVAQSNLRLPC